jgi:hypothetical protein
MRQKMRRIGLLLVLLVALMAMAVPPALAARPHPGDDPKVGPKGNKNAIMYLTTKLKDASEPDPNEWLPDTAGDWGKLRHNQSGATFDFTFNGYGLEPGGYALIYKEVAWPDDHFAWNFGQGVADAKGRLTIKASWVFGSAAPGTYSMWFWLVPCGDVWPECSSSYVELSGWQMETYLFAYDEVVFNLTPY